MAGDDFQEKTEDPTPRKREQARQEGNVPRSKEIPSAFILLTAALGFSVAMPYIAGQVRGFLRALQPWIRNPDPDFTSVMGILGLFGSTLLSTLGPIMFGLAAVSLLIGFIQGRGVFSSKALEPKLSHLNPLEGFKKIYGIRALINLLKQVFRLVLIGAVAYATIRSLWPDLLGLMGAPPFEVASAAYRMTLRLLGLTALAYLVLAGADYGFEYWEQERKLRMSVQEVKEEMKNTDGDPLLKSKIRESMQKIARGRMMRDVPTADVVIVNPTHRAIALRYRAESDYVPVVVAMGERKLALKIRALAEEHGIPLVEDRTLAKALIATATVGSPIPAEFYQAVAKILAYIYTARHGIVSPRRSISRPI